MSLSPDSIQQMITEAFINSGDVNSGDALLNYWFCIVEAASSRFESRGETPRLVRLQAYTVGRVRVPFRHALSCL